MNVKEIMSLMEDINYGWVDKNGLIHNGVDDNFASLYILQSPKEILSSKVGGCWDQVELERYYFKNTRLNIKTYFIVHYDNDKCPTHTFLTYEKDDNYYWFEHSWEIFKGIHKYSSKEELLRDVKNKFIKNELHNKYDKDNLFIYEYTKPREHLTVEEFYEHCNNGKIY